MYSRIKLAAKFLGYYLSASNGHGHGMHSPFVYDFIRNVLIDDRHYYAYDIVERFRALLLKEDALLEVEDMGAGSAYGAKSQRRISSIAASAAKGRKLSQLLFRIVKYYQPSLIIELGTSLGISSAYMSLANPGAKIFTIEGSPAIANAARQYHRSMKLNNVQVITGNFDQQLHEVLKKHPQPDLVFVDGNHRREPTLRYFDLLLQTNTPQSIFIFDDIHWSKEMEEAWEIIKNNPAVTASIDLFFFGIVLFRNEFKSRQHFTIRF